MAGPAGHLLIPILLPATTVSTVTGTSAVTLANFTSSASGSEVVGTSTRTLADATPSASGAHGVAGTSTPTLGNATSTATGSFGSNVTGTVAATLANFTSAASGSEVAGTSTQTLANATSTATGTHSVTGTSARTLANATPAATGGFGPSGTSAQTLANATSSAVGQYGSTIYVLNDAFPGSSIDTTQWTVYNRLPDMFNNEEDALVPANVRVASGSLLIDQKFEDAIVGDTTTGAPNPRTMHYTSGQVAQSRVPFLYGDVQVRAKIQGGTGNWPCIWMLGHLWQASQPFTANVAGNAWPSGGWYEIDIAEFIFDHRTVVNTSLHFPSAGAVEERSLPFNATSRFMVYRLVWTPTTLTWYVDGEDGVGWRTLRTVSGAAGTVIPNTPGYLIIHTAIGGGAATTPDSSTFPTTMEIDYAQVAMIASSIDNGAAAVTLGNATSSAAGAFNVSGTSARTLGNATSSATGGHGVAGTSARTLGNFTSTATGAFGSNPVGTAAVTLANFTSAASGSEVVGTSAPTLGNATSTASGTAGSPTITGTASPTLANATSTASGSETIGSGAVTLSNLTPAAAGVLGVAGTSSVTLAPFTPTASGSETLGSLARTLAPFTSTASGSSGIIFQITGRPLRTRRADDRRMTRKVGR